MGIGRVRINLLLASSRELLLVPDLLLSLVRPLVLVADGAADHAGDGADSRAFARVAGEGSDRQAPERASGQRALSGGLASARKESRREHGEPDQAGPPQAASMPCFPSGGLNMSGSRNRSMSSEKRSIRFQPFDRLVPPLKITL